MATVETFLIIDTVQRRPLPVPDGKNKYCKNVQTIPAIRKRVTYTAHIRVMNAYPDSGQSGRVPEVCLSVPVPSEDSRLIPFWRVVGSMMEWTAGLISDDELCRALRKAAAEVERGGC